MWDNGNADRALAQFVLRHDAVLAGPDSQSLYVIDRPMHPGQFLAAALAPDGFKDHHFDGVDEPNAIAVHKDPVRAATQISRRLLPRYHQALNAVRDNARRQPEPPPPRPTPPAVNQVVTFTWHTNGTLATPAAGLNQEAKTTLYLHGFQHRPRDEAFLLPTAYGDAGQALRIQEAARQLAAYGVGVNLRHATPIATGTRSAAHRETRPARHPRR
ncbi:hypothetical protein ACWGDX_19270 [Streptomyces sp. NPDC055025]